MPRDLAVQNPLPLYDGAEAMTRNSGRTAWSCSFPFLLDWLLLLRGLSSTPPVQERRTVILAEKRSFGNRSRTSASPFTGYKPDRAANGRDQATYRFVGIFSKDTKLRMVVERALSLESVGHLSDALFDQPAAVAR